MALLASASSVTKNSLKPGGSGSELAHEGQKAEDIPVSAFL
jgi:hypothetical protein